MLFLSLLTLTATTGVVLANPWTGSPTLAKKAIISSCPASANQQISCQNTTVQTNSCCLESPGGLLLQTQFWDTDPSTGPSDSWTIHGLWPDNCDEGYQQNCDPSRAYTGLPDIMTALDATDTLQYMQKMWLDINGRNTQLWEHEWSKHGTCMSTLRPSCFPPGSAQGSEAVAYFNTAVRLFKGLPTHAWLAKHGILPTTSQTFTLAQLTDALKQEFGFTPALDCSSGNLNGASYYYYLKGSIVDGTFVAIDAPKKGSCPSSGIKYVPKDIDGSKPSDPSGPGPTVTTSSTPRPTTTQTPGSLPAKATITAQLASGAKGGLISNGAWSDQTLATYSLSGSDSDFIMTTSKGLCAVDGGKLACGPSVTEPSSFGSVSTAGGFLLSFENTTDFSSSAGVGGILQQLVYVGRSQSNVYSLVINPK